MTREEAISELQACVDAWDKWMLPGCSSLDKYKEAVRMSLAALRGPTREQVVACKDCRFWQGNNGGYPHPECRWGRDETPDEDDYCSFAERLEVNKNG